MTSIKSWQGNSGAVRTARRVGIVVLRRVGRILLMILIVGFLGAMLVRFGPGFEMDDSDFDNRISEDTRSAMRAQRAADANIVAFYVAYIRKALHGDLGSSYSYKQPVSDLIRDRLPVTLESIAYGVLGGISLGFFLATVTLLWRSRGYDFFSSLLSGLCLSIPAAVLALLFLWAGSNGRWAIALVVFPYVYRYSKNLLVATYTSPHVLTAFAKGLTKGQVLVSHVLTPLIPQLASIAGMSVTLAFGAAIPIEVICDSPGIGQLVVQVASGRDLPLLVGITLLVALMTMVVNGLADLALDKRAPA